MKSQNGRPPLPIEVGQKFARLVAIKRIGPRLPSGNIEWLFHCQCGNETAATVTDVKRGFVKSCGCLHIETLATGSQASIKHGMFGTPEYTAWADMWARCTNPKKENYKYYGARGVKVCKRWKKFENFIADLGLRPGKGFELDRKNVNGNYTPTNCRWIPRGTGEQRKHRRTT